MVDIETVSELSNAWWLAEFESDPVTFMHLGHLPIKVASQKLLHISLSQA